MTSYLCELAASIDTVSEVVGWAEDATTSHADLAPASINVLLVCVQELVANVALHANSGHGVPTVRINLHIEAEKIAVLIEDDGHPFDPLQDAPYRDDKDLASAHAGGRGVRIVRQLARAMSYRRVGEWNCLRFEIG